jgi:hypothetical protein
MLNQPHLLTALSITAGLLILTVIMVFLVKWARKRTTGALATGALLSAFAPDPTLERNIRLAEQAKIVQMEEDEDGGE